MGLDLSPEYRHDPQEITILEMTTRRIPSQSNGSASERPGSDIISYLNHLIPSLPPLVPVSRSKFSTSLTLTPNASQAKPSTHKRECHSRLRDQSTDILPTPLLYIIPVIIAGLLLQILFLANMSYMYGALFKSGSRMHNLRVLAVDFDGGDVGRALSEGYSHLKSAEFPTVEWAAPSEYPKPDSLREAVCKHGYWAAIYTSSDATDRVLAAMEGDNKTAYEASHAMTYIYNSIYYPATFSSLRGSLQALVSVTSKVFPFLSSDALAAVNMTNPVSAAAFLNPIDATAWDIMPTSQGT
jgi:hypothetical protein